MVGTVAAAPLQFSVAIRPSVPSDPFATIPGAHDGPPPF
jgi:hypothetical protein